MSFDVYLGDSTRIVWKKDLPRAGGQVTSPYFLLLGLNCKLRFWTRQNVDSKEILTMIFWKTGVGLVDRKAYVMIYIVNKHGRLSLLTDSLIPVTLNSNQVQFLIKNTNAYPNAVYEDKVTIVIDFCFKKDSNLENLKTTTKVKEEISAPSSFSVNPCTESLAEDLQKFLEDDSQHDLALKHGNESIPVHKSILSARSTVFAAMLRNDMREGRSGVVDIADMEIPVLEHFVRYIYCGVLPELTVELASDLFKAGDKYAVKALMKRCSQFLVKSLTVENACEVLVLADDHSDPEFKESVVSYILDKEVPKKYGDWVQFCRSRPFLGLEVLNRYVFKN